MTDVQRVSIHEMFATVPLMQLTLYRYLENFDYITMSIHSGIFNDAALTTKTF